ncbi:MAG: hypothetical protein V1936_02555 [Patescibacteria group bacterium]
MKKSHFNKIAIILAVIAALSLVAGIFTGRHGPGKLGELPRLEYNARPQRPPEIVGKIESLVGNQATIAKLEKPNWEDQKTSPAERRAAWEALKPAERIAKMEARLNAFTGENIVVEIPAGIEITRRSAPPKDLAGLRELAKNPDLPNTENKTVSPIELAQGDYVAIWLDGKISDKNVAEFINLILIKQDAVSQPQ